MASTATSARPARKKATTTRKKAAAVPRKPAKKTAARRKKEAKKDLAKTDNEFKEFEGQHYTGMRVGRSYKRINRGYA
ncbi:hypothetical protein [Chitinophaga sp. 22620]|uniref:hypothetical protein n=1 Tax=Chitinophaga sp. 22620 TaxID=3453952 RepID=UPI003F825AFE